MKKLQDNKAVHNTGGLQSEKTNQDFNQKKPDPKDPNEKKAIPESKARKIIKERGPSGHGANNP